MGELKEQWSIIKSRSSSEEEKDAAKKRINEIEKTSGYEITKWNTKKSTKSDSVGTVVWPKIDSVDRALADSTIRSFEREQAVAVEIAKKQHPDMPENSNVFGQIVNAILTNIINIQNSK